MRVRNDVSFSDKHVVLILIVINYNFNAFFISQTDSYPGDLFA